MTLINTLPPNFNYPKVGVLSQLKTDFISTKSDNLLIHTDELSDSSIGDDSISETASVTTPDVTSAVEKVQARTTKALCVVAKHTYGIANDIPYPSIDTPDEVIIRTQAVGLNPIDWKSVDYNFCMPSFPWIGGREVAGVVEEVGANVKNVKVGDRVWASM